MKHDLRRWMTLAESAGTTVRVFHGSPESALTFRAGLFYGVRDFGFAASYAVDRGNGKGFVHTLDFHFDKLADDDICYQIADELNVDISGTNTVSIPDDNHPLYDDDYGRVFARLKELGYNGITGHDFGFRADFEELVVWVVFDAASQITPVSVTPVTADDMKSNHPPG
jgi:hypothetical protein